MRHPSRFCFMGPGGFRFRATGHESLRNFARSTQTVSETVRIALSAPRLRSVTFQPLPPNAPCARHQPAQRRNGRERRRARLHSPQSPHPPTSDACTATPWSPATAEAPSPAQVLFALISAKPPARRSTPQNDASARRARVFRPESARRATAKRR